MDSSSVVLEKLRAKMPEMKKYGVKRIGLFGSFVRGEETEKSDLDIIVEFEKKKKTFRNYMELRFLLEDLFDRRVDLVTREALKPDLRARILRSAKYA
ncbi:MAG: nucleotidyltransferase family protein [Thermoanaerobacterales bacterium]|nr:nucleotidyltransferase family protein [Bacillota bacterium]MDI6906936.1 nucleotidyltransferase family protein [Thermoanaerobacterales bacterium]